MPATNASRRRPDIRHAGRVLGRLYLAVAQVFDTVVTEVTFTRLTGAALM